MNRRRRGISADGSTIVLLVARRWDRGYVPLTRDEMSSTLGWSLLRVREGIWDAVLAGYLRLIPRRARAYGLTTRGFRVLYGASQAGRRAA